MKIIFFNTYNKSFLSDFFVHLSEGLLSAGYEVKIYCLKSENRIVLLKSGVSINIIKKGHRFSNYMHLFKVIKSERPHVVVSNFSFANPVALSSKLLGVPNNIIWYHTLKNQMNFNRRSIFIKSLFMDMTSNIITNSLELKDEISKDYRQPYSKIHCLPFTTTINSIERKEISIVKESKFTYIGCPGRINSDKNQSLLIDILSVLNDNTIILVFAGSKDEDVLVKHKDYTQFQNRIIYLGNLSKEEMVDFYAKMDVIILPSLNEAFGLVLIESLASGATTLVSNRFGALGYIKQDVGLITFDPKNSIDLANKLKTVLTNRPPEAYFKQLYHSNFSMEEIVNQFISIIKN